MGASFTVTTNNRGVVGDMEYVEGKAVSGGGATGGEIPTGLREVRQIFIQQYGSAVGTGPAVVNEVFPLASGDITIVTDADATVSFMALGR